MTGHTLPAPLVAALYRDACRFDVLAAKPGNVSIGSAGHGMQAVDFLTSARVTADPLARAARGVGAAVREAIDATWGAVGCNTNLGIVLLAAPLAQAVRRPLEGSLRTRLARVLAGLDLADAEDAFAAIRRAHPAGLGTAAAEDVAASPTHDLRHAMQLAAERDRIAWNYVHDYADVFDVGIPALRAGLHADDSLSAAVVRAFLRFLASMPDTHVERKLGEEAARRLMGRAAELESAYKACEDPEERAALVQTFDCELKRGGVNPGTSADLTVTSLFAMNLAAALQNAR